MEFPTKITPYAIASADLDLDGIPDLAIANLGPNNRGNTVSILYGNGDGTFRPQVELNVTPNYPDYSGPLDVAIGDVNEDGRPDILVLNAYGAEALSIFLGTPLGFEAGPVYTSGTYGLNRFAVADMDGDGHLDVVAAGASGLLQVDADYRVFIWHGVGDGTFDPPTTVSGNGSFAVAIGDVDEDGTPDVVTTNFLISYYRSGVAGEFSVMTGTGDSLNAPVSFPSPDYPRDVALGDLDQDGHLDAVTANTPPGDRFGLRVYMGDGHGHFAYRDSLKAHGFAPWHVLIADMNGDGLMDIVANSLSTPEIRVYLGTGGGAFATPVVIAAPSSPYHMLAADLNQDGRRELSVVDLSRNTVSIYLNTGCDPLSRSISLVLPDHGGDTGDVTVSIYGCGFQEGATAFLRGPGGEIVANPVTVTADGTVEAVFALLGKPLGQWDVVVQDAFGAVVKSQGFTIEPGREPSIWVETLGRFTNRTGTPYRDAIVGRNDGNVTFHGLAYVCIENYSCAEEAALVTASGCPITPFASGSSAAFILPWDLRHGGLTTEFYDLTGTAGGNGASCDGVPAGSQEPPPSPTQGYVSVTRFQAQSQGEVSPAAVVVERDGIHKDGLLPRFWSRVAGSPPWPSSFSQGFLLDLKQALNAELERVVKALYSGSCEGQTVALGADEVILQAMRAVLLSDLAQQYPADLDNIRACFDQIYAPGGTPAYRDLFRDALCEVSREYGEDRDPPVTANWIGERKSFPRYCGRGGTLPGCDPNGKYGPEGFVRFLPAGAPLDYSVFFENEPTSPGTTAEVTLVDQLDPSLVDLSTFRFGPVTVRDKSVNPAPGQNPVQMEVDLPERNLKVRITAQLNTATGLVQYRFQSLDPATGLPIDEFTPGFLPPNIAPPEGQGSVSFSVMPRGSLAGDTRIDNRAIIVFVPNAPIETDPWSNTIDVTKPTSSVNALSRVDGDATKLVVAWSGQDGASGIRDYEIFVSDNAGPWTSWRLTSAVQDTIPVEDGHTYAFYSIARDRVGNREDAPTAPDASITISGCDVVMGFDLTPNTLNLRSMGHWVTAYLTPPAPFTATDIDTPSVRINGSLAPDPAAPVEIGDFDGNGVSDMKLKFSRYQLERTVDAGDRVPITVTGTIGGTCFTGSDSVRIIRAIVTTPGAGNVLQPGARAPVRWLIPPGIDVQWVALLSSLDDGATWSLDARDLPNTGVAEWLVPSVTTSEARVAVVLVQSADETGEIVDGVLGTSDAFSIDQVTGVTPDARVEFALRVARPNSAQGELKITFGLPEARPARLELFSVAGALVASREVGSLGAGVHSLTLRGRSTLSSGVYFVRLRQGSRSITKRAVVIR